MIKAGFEDASPDALDPENFTWGANALLNGPERERLKAARLQGNNFGFTDRLDYIFTKNGIKAKESNLVSHTWPEGEFNWRCLVENQVETCFPSDHAGIISTLVIPTSIDSEIPEPLPDHQTFPWLKAISLLIALFLIALILWLFYRLIAKPLIIKPLTKRKAHNDKKRI